MSCCEWTLVRWTGCCQEGMRRRRAAERRHGWPHDLISVPESDSQSRLFSQKRRPVAIGRFTVHCRVSADIGGYGRTNLRNTRSGGRRSDTRGRHGQHTRARACLWNSAAGCQLGRNVGRIVFLWNLRCQWPLCGPWCASLEQGTLPRS